MAENNLPTANINRLFSSLAEYQRQIGSGIGKRNYYITKQEITTAIEDYFTGSERIINSRKDFFEKFTISKSVIEKRYETFEAFCKEFGISVLIKKKAKYTKKEIDDLIIAYIKRNNSIPTHSSSLVKEGLPSRDVILKYYDDWKEPFILYMKLFETYNN